MGRGKKREREREFKIFVFSKPQIMDKANTPIFTEIWLLVHAQLDIVEWLARTDGDDDYRTFRRFCHSRMLVSSDKAWSRGQVMGKGTECLLITHPPFQK